MNSALKSYRWIPSLFFMEGLPFAIVAIVPLLLYKNFGMNNTKIAFYTSLMTIPWFLKPLLSPFFEKLATKQKIILTAQFLIALFF